VARSDAAYSAYQMTSAFVIFIVAGIRHEQNLYIKLIDATTKKVRFYLGIGADFAKLNLGPKLKNKVFHKSAHV